MTEAIKLGLVRGAVVVSGNPFKKYYMNMILKAGNMYKIKIVVFSNMEKAQKWLVSFGDYK